MGGRQQLVLKTWELLSEHWLWQIIFFLASTPTPQPANRIRAVLKNNFYSYFSLTVSQTGEFYWYLTRETEAKMNSVTGKGSWSAVRFRVILVTPPILPRAWKRTNTKDLKILTTGLLLFYLKPTNCCALQRLFCVVMVRIQLCEPMQFSIAVSSNRPVLQQTARIPWPSGQSFGSHQ